jgi:hypothetical protein
MAVVSKLDNALLCLSHSMFEPSVFTDIRSGCERPRCQYESLISTVLPSPTASKMPLLRGCSSEILSEQSLVAEAKQRS